MSSLPSPPRAQGGLRAIAPMEGQESSSVIKRGQASVSFSFFPARILQFPSASAVPRKTYDLNVRLRAPPLPRRPLSNPLSSAERNGEFSGILLLFSISVSSVSWSLLGLSRAPRYIYSARIYKIPPFLRPSPPRRLARPALPILYIPCSERTAGRLYKVGDAAARGAPDRPIIRPIIVIGLRYVALTFLGR